MMLAEIASPNSTQLFGWLASFAALLVIWNQFRKAIDREKDKPSAGEVRGEASEKFVPKVEFQAHVAKNDREHENLFKKIGGVERGHNERMDLKLLEMQKSAEDGREKLHRRLNRISIGLATLCGRMGAPMPSEEEEL